jgi:hypothetical protein
MRSTKGEKMTSNIAKTINETFKSIKEEGKVEGKIEDIIEISSDIGTVLEKLKSTICSQTDIEVLKSWIKLAAKCDSIGEFQDKAKLN